MLILLGFHHTSETCNIDINISHSKLKNRDMTDVETYMINNKYIIIYKGVEYGNEDIYKRN